MSVKPLLLQSTSGFIFSIMKTITLKVEIEVPDDYVLDDEEWLLEDAMDPYDRTVKVVSISKAE